MHEAREMRIHGYGGPEAMRVETVSLPSPGAGQVLLRQRAVGVNFIDVYHRKGVFPIPALPGVVGVEASGEVEAVGPDVTAFKVGDRIAYAGPPIGSYVDLRLMPAAKIVRLPDAIGFEDAASLMLKGMTGHMLLKRVRPLQVGDSVLIHAAAGGLGSILCQWARAMGARVIGTVGSPEKADAALRLGCSKVILYRDVDFVAEVRRVTEGRGVDVVYEGVGGDVLTKSLQCLAPFGLAVNLGQAGNPLQSVELADLGPQRSLSVAVPGVFAHLRTCGDLQAAADEMFSVFTSGRVKATIGHRMPLEGASEAHRLLESGKTTGAIVLQA